jgi:nitrite reductase/ring-hydroxylating ferredoxin subunit
VRVASKADLLEKRRLTCSVRGVNILLIYANNEVIALEDKCTHLGKPLHDGRLIGGTIICPFHGACFSLETGESLAGPAIASVCMFVARVEGEDIFLRLAVAEPSVRPRSAA